jgi:hypothetical protein
MMILLLSPKPKPKPKNGMYYNAYMYRRLFYHQHCSTTITTIFSIEQEDEDDDHGDGIWICSYCELRSDRQFIKDHISTCPKKQEQEQ